MKTNYFFKSVVMAAVCLLPFQLNAADKITTPEAIVDGVGYSVINGGSAAGVVALEITTKDDGSTSNTKLYTQASITILANVTINGTSYPVKKIENNSMRENPNLVSITIPEGVETIGNSAFAQCDNLPAVVLPSTVNKIEDWAFYGCKKLASINIPNGITAITEHTFQESALTSIELPASVKLLGTCSFQNAKQLATINLENITELGGYSLFGTAISGNIDLQNVTKLGNEAFGVCPNIETINLPNVLSMGDWVFKQCAKLKSVSLAKVQTSGNYLFDGTHSLENFYAPKLQGTGNQSFKDCVNLTTVDLSGVSSIGDWAFQGCENLSNLKVSSNIKVINAGAFSGCKSITSLVLPPTVEYIGEWALEKTGLTELFISWDQDGLDVLSTFPESFGEDEGRPDLVVKVPADLKDLYGDEWEDYPVEIGVPAGITNTQADKIDVYYANGHLTLTNLDGQNVSVISLDGRVLTTLNVDGAVSEVPVQLNSGVYVLRANNTSAKFIVK